jgi:hypothetical protein
MPVVHACLSFLLMEVLECDEGSPREAGECPPAEISHDPGHSVVLCVRADVSCVLRAALA